MTDDKTKTGQPDRSRVNIHEPYEVAHWTKKWGITPKDLEAAVAAVGPLAHNIAKHLGKSL